MEAAMNYEDMITRDEFEKRIKELRTEKTAPARQREDVVQRGEFRLLLWIGAFALTIISGGAVFFYDGLTELRVAMERQYAGLRVTMEEQHADIRATMEEQHAGLRAGLRATMEEQHAGIRATMEEQHAGIRTEIADVRENIADLRERMARVETRLGGQVEGPASLIDKR